MHRELYAIILAAGDGRRLEAQTMDASGRSVPKQFYRFDGHHSLLERTLARAGRLVPAGRIVPIVARSHSDWWARDLAGIDSTNIVVQPANRGTAAGILLPLQHVMSLAPDAIVAVFPSDHHVEDETTFADAVEGAAAAIDAHPGKVVLLGISPERPDTEYGWILPDEPSGAHAAGFSSSRPRPVARFVEKPFAIEAAELMHRGALWNSFVFVASARTLVQLFEQRMPFLAGEMAFCRGDGAALDALYARLETHDFSREVLQKAPDALLVSRVPACGWTDLGTPDRLAEVFGNASPKGASAAA